MIQYKFDVEPREKWKAFLIFFAAIVTPSPLFLNFGPFKGNAYFILALFVLIFTQLKRFRVNLFFIFSGSIILIFYLAGLIYWQESKLLLFPIYFILSWIVIFCTSTRDIELFIKYSSIFAFILVIGGFLGLIYTLSGGQEIFSIANEDTRLNGFYLTTFSNSYVRGTIRPSGIYDEPGALSFVICFVAAIRKLWGCDDKLTWAILILGFFTMSLAHFIFFILFVLHDLRKWSFKTFTIFILIIVSLLLLLYNSILWEVFLEFFFGRLKIENGVLVGDNRTALWENARDYLDLKVFFFGLDVENIVRPELASRKGYNQFGDNPLGALVLGGLTLFLPYYLVLIFLLFTSIRYVNFIYFALFLLLLQRIEVMTYGYSLLVAITIYVIFARHINKYNMKKSC